MWSKLPVCCSSADVIYSWAWIKKKVAAPSPLYYMTDSCLLKIVGSRAVGGHDNVSQSVGMKIWK